LQGLALYGIDPDEIKAYAGKVEAVTSAQAADFARKAFDPAKASTIVAGDAKLFGAALKAAEPSLETIPIAAFDPDNPTLKAAP
ncbi:MAG: hypothetical protein ACREEQ_07675, partial [Caulobacteraceae bacterium]